MLANAAVLVERLSSAVFLEAGRIGDLAAEVLVASGRAYDAGSRDERRG
jgi:uncharacterized RDD family membrane protein YckC